MSLADPVAPEPPDDRSPWWAGVTRYQWLVLAVASAGWVFDVYEGQIFNITSGPLLADVLDTASDSAAVKLWRQRLFGVFLAGGAIGGIGFGLLADRWGRRPTLVATILLYSIFSGLTGFADSLWQVVVLRFLVAIGTGGEWAVAAALVAEVFPARARAHGSSIFHASSTLGTWLAAVVGLLVTHWSQAFFVGVLPALLILFVRANVRESDAWAERRVEGERRGSLRELLGVRPWRDRAILGLLLATAGLSTFWGVTVAGQELAKEALVREGVAEDQAEKRSRFAYGIVQATGGGLGLLAFGPLSARLGRRRAFVVMQLAALVVVPLTCFVPQTYYQLLALLPLYGFVTLSIHAGFAVYFPELFPTRLRATGASFCFNGGRLLSAGMLYLSGEIKEVLELRTAIALLSLLFLLGIAFVLMLPETKGRPLPE
jgi:MFS family permease